jgi:hypothetical protein
VTDLLDPRTITLPGVPAAVTESALFRTDLGAFVIGDCLTTLRAIPDETFDLVRSSSGRSRSGEHEAAPF